MKTAQPGGSTRTDDISALFFVRKKNKETAYDRYRGAARRYFDYLQMARGQNLCASVNTYVMFCGIQNVETRCHINLCNYFNSNFEDQFM
jgi:hypothetical protein